MGETVYLATVYFVDPDIICGRGRTWKEFQRKGTGNTLIIQRGSTAARENLFPVPQTKKAALANVSLVLGS
jgi:hypothetical protein